MFKNGSFNIKNQFFNSIRFKKHTNLSINLSGYSKKCFAKKSLRDDDESDREFSEDFKNNKNDVGEKNAKNKDLENKKESEKKSRLHKKDGTPHCLVLHPIFHKEK